MPPHTAASVRGGPAVRPSVRPLPEGAPSQKRGTRRCSPPKTPEAADWSHGRWHGQTGRGSGVVWRRGPQGPGLWWGRHRRGVLRRLRRRRRLSPLVSWRRRLGLHDDAGEDPVGDHHAPPAGRADGGTRETHPLDRAAHRLEPLRVHDDGVPLAEVLLDVASAGDVLRQRPRAPARATLFAGGGYLLADRWQTVEVATRRTGGVGLLVLPVAGLAWWWYRRRAGPATGADETAPAAP